MSAFVSILMPCYNASRFVTEAAESALAQTHADFELIAVDDGSTDDTLAKLHAVAARDSRVKVRSHENRGMGPALNDAMEAAGGEWIVRMDADDVMVPRRIERQLAFVADRPDLIVGSSLVQYIDERGAIIGRNRSDFTDPARVAEAVRKRWAIGFHHPAVIMRRDVIRALGGYRHRFWPADDIDLWGRVLDVHPAGVLVQGEYLLNYRIHGASVSVAQSRNATEKVQWVEACLRARREAMEEPTFDQFREIQRRMPWPVRANRARREAARSRYKTAVFHFSCRRYVRFGPNLLLAACLEPSYVVQRVMPQLQAMMGSGIPAKASQTREGQQRADRTDRVGMETPC